MPWSGFGQTRVAHSAWACTIGHSRRGRRWLRCECSSDRVEHGAEHVVLSLIVGTVADPHRTSPAVAAQVIERRLLQVAAAVDAVHDLHPAVGVGLEVGDELHELVRLPVEVQPVQRLQRERRVAHPAVAVVPVPLAAGRLGQAGREGRHRRPGGHVGQSLDHQRRPLDRLTVPVVRDAGPAQPVAARTPPSSPAGARHRRRRRAHRSRRPTTSRSTPARPLAARDEPGRSHLRCRPGGRSGAGRSCRRRSLRRCDRCHPPGSRSPGRARSRRSGSQTISIST